MTRNMSPATVFFVIVVMGLILPGIHAISHANLDEMGTEASVAVGNAVGLERIAAPVGPNTSALYEAAIYIVQRGYQSRSVYVDIFRSKFDPSIMHAFLTACRKGVKITFLYEPLSTPPGSNDTRCAIVRAGCSDWVPYAPRNSPVYIEMRANPCMSPNASWIGSSPLMLHAKDLTSGDYAVVQTNALQPHWGYFDLAFIYGPSSAIPRAMYDVLSLATAKTYDILAVGAAIDRAAAAGLAYQDPEANRSIFSAELKRVILNTKKEFVWLVKLFDNPRFTAWFNATARSMPHVQFNVYVDTAKIKTFPDLCTLSTIKNVNLSVSVVEGENAPPVLKWRRLHGTVLFLDRARVAIGTPYASTRTLNDPISKNSREVTVWTKEAKVLKYISNMIHNINTPTGLYYTTFNTALHCPP